MGHAHKHTFWPRSRRPELSGCLTSDCTVSNPFQQQGRLAGGWQSHAGREQRAESREQRAESREQRAESREQRAESREQRAESREQRAKTKEQRAKGSNARTSGREPKVEDPNAKRFFILFSALCSWLYRLCHPHGTARTPFTLVDESRGGSTQFGSARGPFPRTPRPSSFIS